MHAWEGHVPTWATSINTHAPPPTSFEHRVQEGTYLIREAKQWQVEFQQDTAL